MKEEIARMEELLTVDEGTRIYHEEKAYVAIIHPLNGTHTIPGILFGTSGTYAFYSGNKNDPTMYVLTRAHLSPQKAIDDIYRFDGTVYEFDTIREAMTFFLEHLKEEE